MSNFISDSRFIQAAMFRMCFGLVFAGMAVAAHTAQSAEGSFARDLDILSIQRVPSGTDWLFPYQVRADIVLARPENIAPVRSGFSNTLRLGLVAEPKEETAWSTNARWQIAPGSDRTSLSPILHLESKGDRLEIKPRRNSISVVWRKAFR